MKKIVLLLLFIFSISGFSQTISGIIVNKNNQPIEGVFIYNPKSSVHTHTNENGYFVIEKTNTNESLQISAVGYLSQTTTVENSNITIVLEPTSYNIEEITITSQSNVLKDISKIDLAVTPVKSSQELLRKVPGLFIGQHAGGGKAEQIFLRGFDIDHGTDIAIAVDGMPINMVSHAHGQGYADLHFVIPETVENIDFGKGTYYANKGDFTTAGYVDFKTKNSLENSAISLETGQFNTFRATSLFNLLEKNDKNNAYFATEYVKTDGPFESPQNFKRINLFGKYTSYLNDKSNFSITVSRFSSDWTASGQIPQRIVDSKTINRFGAVDDTEGGNTSRTNFNVSYFKPIKENVSLKTNVFISKYDFELYSNFTFFLENPINGDQIKQKENRTIYGLNSEINTKKLFSNSSLNFQIGFGFRADETKDTELSHTKNRQENLNYLKLGNINQTNIFSYLNTSYDFGKFKINPAIRFDYFDFEYYDKLLATFQIQSETKYKISPKLNLVYAPNTKMQVFAKSGLGFHSNDTRVVTSNINKKTLPTAFSSDLGFVYKPTSKLVINTALWFLNLEQEFIYVGDAGIVEPSGKTERKGIEIGLRYQVNNYIFFFTDANYTYAKSLEAPSGENYIPLAPDFTTTGGISFKNFNRFSGGINYRHLNSRPANEDNSIVAKGYTIADANVNYDLKNISIGITIENLFNSEWNETQFATESQLQNETSSVEEIHFTPGTPFFIKGKITYKF